MDVIDMQKLKPCNRENQLMVSDMTLRDHFAGLAMQGAMANCEVKEKAMSRAQWAYEIADAMLEERLK